MSSLLTISYAQNSKTNIVKNGDTDLFTTLYENPGKETVILLHGGPGVPSDLLEVVEILSKNYQVIGFHQRGTKKSPSKANDFSMNAYVSDIIAISDFYKIPKFHLFGHSWGGLYAQIFAQNHPEKLLSLFLCCPGSGTGAEWKQTEKEVLALNKSKCSNAEWMKMGWNSLLGKLGSDKAHQRLFMQVMRNYNIEFVDLKDLGYDYSHLKAKPINKTRTEIKNYPILNKIEHPNLKISIVYGEKDIYKSSKDFVINRYPSAKVYTILNSGHLPWLHNPKQYEEVLNEHFQ